MFHVGRYFLLVAKIFARPEKNRIYFRQIVKEIESMGINSIGIVIIISFFMGAVITIQTAYNLENPFVPKYYIGLGARDSMILEFSSTIVGLILAGKVGSMITSEIGTMRVTEQIDALEIMGVNSASYLILPKVIAAVVFNPVLNVISITIGILGGYIATFATNVVSISDYVYGLHYWFIPFYITYSFIKTIVFAFIIATVPAYHGYYTSGGALDVGKSATRGVVYTSVLILMFNLVITQLFLS